MKKFKSSTSRLVRLFQNSRDNWKARSADKQKRIRALEIKVRDLTKSRDYWKQVALTGQVESSIPQTVETDELENSAKNLDPPEEIKEPEMERSISVPKGHVYPVLVIQLAIQQLIQGLASLRGCQLNFDWFSPFLEFKLTKTPSFSCIRNWLYRIGLYALTQPQVRGDDWILIPDFRAELGKMRALVILGISQPHFCAPHRVFRESKKGPSFALRHQDVEVMSIKMMTNSTGKAILTQLTYQIGSPVQIVADHGRDLKNGMERYQSNNSSVIYTHDITHHLGIWFKHQLKNDVKYQQFCQKCGSTRSQIQQTQLHFLVPPSSKHKSRYLNVDKYLKWASKVSVFKAKNDYSKISHVYSLDEKTYAALTGLRKKNLTSLQNLGPQTYAHQTRFREAITKALGLKKAHHVLEIICQAADLGRRQFLEQLGWLEDYQPELQAYTQMVTIAHQAETFVKNSGLTKDSTKPFVQNLESFELLPQSQDFKEKIIDYVTLESAKVPDGQTLLATSDVVESLFGKYKWLTSKNCLNELGKRILTRPLCTLSITYEFVKPALESVSERDVDNWNKDVFGQSALSKRRDAFGKTTQK